MRILGLNPWRTSALLIVVAVAVVDVTQMARTVPPPPIEAPSAKLDPATRAERRFAALREYVRTHALKGTIGYVGDLAGSELNANAQAVEDYYLAQFVLLPLVLDPGPGPHGWAVVDRRAADGPSRMPAGWTVIQDFGDGVQLLRREAR